VVTCPRDQLAPSKRLKLDADSEALRDLTRNWGERFRDAFYGLPSFPWEESQVAMDQASELPPGIPS
jgi:putative proteasome-type protease